jgi:hypothetical protein
VDDHTEDWTFMLPDNKLLHAHFDLKRAKGSIPPGGSTMIFAISDRCMY